MGGVELSTTGCCNEKPVIIITVKNAVYVFKNKFLRFILSSPLFLLGFILILHKRFHKMRNNLFFKIT
jgi:hypothetical protein